jgi:asparagine synthase (glutamine-hydrolysing)
MSRIVGASSSRARELVESMGHEVRRGYPDSNPDFVRASAGQGTQLAVLDRCPEHFLWEAEGLSVTLDGAIYNRNELGQFTSDAQLVAELYRKHGFEALLQRLNGDFAIALHDRTHNTLWLARDRFGAKPLYYARIGAELVFASRPAPLVRLPQVGAAINRRFAAVFAASHYRYFDNVPEESPYQRVAQLPAAHWLKWRDGQVQSGRYWRLEDRENFDEPQEALAERYRELLLSAVKLRLESSERAAFTLSGGMDSSSVLASASRLSGAPQEAFSTVYSDKTYDESDEIRPMLQHAVSTWHPIPVDRPDVFALVRRMVEVNDEPVATATWLSHFVLCEQASRSGFRSLFGGLGGDELNAGEYEYFFFHFADLAQAGRTRELEAEIRHWAAHHDHPIYRKNADVATATMARCTDASHPGRCMPDLQRMRRYYPVLKRDFYDIEQFAPIMEAPFSSYLKTRSYQDLTRETAPCCLRAEDRQTQAFGLENHVPFFDHRLVELMFRVPGSMKIADGVTKRLLRDAMRGILPEETRTRVKKTGWNAPAHLWFSGEGRTQLHDLIGSQAFRERGIYEVDEVLRIAKEHDEIVTSGAVRENHMMFLWQLANLELWLQSLSVSAAGRSSGVAP